MNSHVEAYPDWRSRPLLVVARPPEHPEVAALWEQALAICKQEIEDDEDGVPAVDGGFMPYALGYTLMFALGREPWERWRTEAVRRGGRRADPKLRPQEGLSVAAKSNVAQCRWLQLVIDLS
jgi:hypothetical protein